MFNLTKNYILLVIRCILINYHSFKRITCNDAYFEIHSIIHAL